MVELYFLDPYIWVGLCDQFWSVNCKQQWHVQLLAEYLIYQLELSFSAMTARKASESGCSIIHPGSSVQFSSVAQSCPTLCNPIDCSTPGLPVHHQLPELTQTHVHRVSDAIQPSHPLLSPSPPAFNLSQHQGLFKWVSSSHQVAKVLELQLQHQSFQWIFRVDFF